MSFLLFLENIKLGSNVYSIELSLKCTLYFFLYCFYNKFITFYLCNDFFNYNIHHCLTYIYFDLILKSYVFLKNCALSF